MEKRQMEDEFSRQANPILRKNIERLTQDKGCRNQIEQIFFKQDLKSK